MTNSHLFVTGAGLDQIHSDILDSELSAYDYLKLVYSRKYREIGDLFKHLSKDFGLYCEGRMSPEMNKWVKHRQRYDNLDTALWNWR